MSILENEKPMSNQSFWEGGAKTMFFTGLFLGIALTAALAFSGMFAFVWKGGSFGSGPNAVAANPNVPSVPIDPGADAPPAVLTTDVDAGRDHILGNKNAKVTIVEYSDFECPFCQRHEPTVKQALVDFPNDVRLVYRHYPLTAIHLNSQKAAEASECVAKLAGNDGFWKMHDNLFAAQTTGLGTDAFVKAAKDAGVNEAAFKKCLDAGEMAGRVNEDVATGNDSGVQGTPATYVNGQGVDGGAVPYSVLKAALEAAGAKS